MSRTLNCVCDAHTALLPRSLTEGLQALACENCEGLLLSLDDHRRWVERSLPTGDPMPPATADEPANSVAATPVRKCPACAQLMERLLSGTSADFRLDRCGPCQWLWMDAGEWAALEADGATRRLLDILSDGGQRLLRETAVRDRREAELRARHGSDTIDELIRVRAWLVQQPQPDLLLTLLRNGW